jgi:hypothetical protein
MDQLAAAFIILNRNRTHRDKGDARAEQAFYASFEDDLWSNSVRFFCLWRRNIRLPPTTAGDCHNRMTCLDHSNRRAMG